MFTSNSLASFPFLYSKSTRPRRFTLLVHLEEYCKRSLSSVRNSLMVRRPKLNSSLAAKMLGAFATSGLCYYPSSRYLASGALA